MFRAFSCFPDGGSLLEREIGRIRHEVVTPAQAYPAKASAHQPNTYRLVGAASRSCRPPRRSPRYLSPHTVLWVEQPDRHARAPNPAEADACLTQRSKSPGACSR
jgi:hypothetical protein